MIPKRFQCMGLEYTVSIEVIRDSKVDGNFYGNDQRIVISKEANKAVRGVTFWHEYMHCALTQLGYSELNDNEQFVDQMAQCLYQLEQTRTNASS